MFPAHGFGVCLGQSGEHGDSEAIGVGAHGYPNPPNIACESYYTNLLLLSCLTYMTFMTYIHLFIPLLEILIRELTSLKIQQGTIHGIRSASNLTRFRLKPIK